MKTKLAVILLAVITVFSSSSVWAWDVNEYERTVKAVGSHEGNLGFVEIAEGVSPNCENGVLYYDIATSLGKSMLATLLIAKTTKQPVRIAYNLPASIGICYLQLVAI